MHYICIHTKEFDFNSAKNLSYSTEKKKNAVCQFRQPVLLCKHAPHVSETHHLSNINTKITVKPNRQYLFKNLGCSRLVNIGSINRVQRGSTHFRFMAQRWSQHVSVVHHLAAEQSNCTLHFAFSWNLAQSWRSCLLIIIPSFSPSKLSKNISCFSVQTSPPSAPLHPPVPDEYPQPDYMGEAVPSSMCSLGPLSCPGCTEEEQDSSPCPPRRPQPQTLQLCQHILGFAATLHTTEERKLVCRGQDVEYISGHLFCLDVFVLCK